MDSDDERPAYRVLSVRTLVLAALALIVVGVGVGAWLLIAYGNGTPEAANRLDAIKTAGTIVVGTGGAGALWLAARRQRTSEIALRQKDLDQAKVDREFALQAEVAAASAADAVERRVTELYTKAADQLGSAKAPVRLAGLYALERLAQSTPDQRQTIVHLLCAYLRMPEAEDGGSREEGEVRRTVARILATHLRPASGMSFWADIDLDLTGATVAGIDLSGCTLRTLTCTNACFDGYCDFTGLTVRRAAEFAASGFREDVTFSGVTFDGTVSFAEARFEKGAGFDGARFLVAADFRDTAFDGAASFDRTEFRVGVDLARAVFHDDVRFASTVFGGPVSFDKAQFRAAALFAGVRFGDRTRFDNARFHSFAEFEQTRFDEYVEFSQARFDGDTRFNGVVFADSARFKTARFTGDARVANTWVKLDVPATVQRTWPRIERARPGRFDVVPADGVSEGSPPDADGYWGQLRYVRAE